MILKGGNNIMYTFTTVVHIAKVYIKLLPPFILKRSIQTVITPTIVIVIALILLVTITDILKVPVDEMPLLSRCQRHRLHYILKLAQNLTENSCQRCKISLLLKKVLILDFDSLSETRKIGC